MIKYLDENISLEKSPGSEFGEDNVDLSTGQSQLVAILRAMYNGKNVLILDEPCANLDVKNEKKLYKNI